MKLGYPCTSQQNVLASHSHLPKLTARREEKRREEKRKIERKIENKITEQQRGKKNV